MIVDDSTSHSKIRGMASAFTPREKEVVRLISLGCTVGEAAKILKLAPSTVVNHKARIMAKLGVDKTAILTRLALKHRITSMKDKLTAAEKRRSGRREWASAEDEWTSPTPRKGSPAKPLKSGQQLGVALASVEEVIEDARRIVDLAPDWDGEGGLGCTQETWERTRDAIIEHESFLWKTHGKAVTPIRMTPDLEGGIDVHWRSGTIELLLNVPPDTSKPITFFGNDRERHATCKTSGELLRGGQAINLGIIAWLAQMT